MKRPAPERLMPMLIGVEQELDLELDLESLASRFGASPFHFHRVFSEAVGETPKKHVQRLRLERAAYRLAVTDIPILELGLELGFKNAETFARNFKRFTGYTPSGYRRMAKAAQARRLAEVDFFASDDYRLSRATFETLPPMHLLAVRNMGSYGTLHESFGEQGDRWEWLRRWALEAGAPIRAVLMGIYYDDPTMTPPPLQRADVCIPVDREIDAADDVRCIRFPGGPHAVASYVGRVSELLSAYRGLADEVRRSGEFEFRDGPALMFLREANVGGIAGVHHLEAGFPVARRR